MDALSSNTGIGLGSVGEMGRLETKIGTLQGMRVGIKGTPIKRQMGYLCVGGGKDEFYLKVEY